jgi:hypothetical protein
MSKKLLNLLLAVVMLAVGRAASARGRPGLCRRSR